MSNLSELFAKARQYGLVSLYTLDTGKYFCRIEFASIEHTKLEAKSDFSRLSPEDAVQMATESAIAIVRSVQKMPTPQRQISNGKQEA